LMLRDLLIALVLCAFLYYLVSRRYIPLAVSLVLIYYLRNQCAYILILAAAVWIYCSLRRQIPLAVRISSAGIILTAGIFISAAGRFGYIYDYCEPLFLLNFASWLPFGFLGLDFIMQGTGVLAASVSSLIFYRIISPETVLLPVLFIITAFHSGKSERHARLLFVVSAALLAYCFGYYIEYRLMFIRLFIPFYPVLFVLSYDTAAALIRRISVPARRKESLS
ncbi:MAG: hypothetical protein ACRCUT_11695, partial [Spirochaetota bacterium]